MFKEINIWFYCLDCIGIWKGDWDILSFLMISFNFERCWGDENLKRGVNVFDNKVKIICRIFGRFLNVCRLRGLVCCFKIYRILGESRK